jgi:hypothetical protein
MRRVKGTVHTEEHFIMFASSFTMTYHWTAKTRARVWTVDGTPASVKEQKELIDLLEEAEDVSIPASHQNTHSVGSLLRSRRQTDGPVQL